MAKKKRGGRRFGGGIFKPLMYGAVVGGIAQMVMPKKIPFQPPIAGAAGAVIGGARSPMPVLIGAAGGVAGATLVNMAGSGTMSASNLAFY